MRSSPSSREVAAGRSARSSEIRPHRCWLVPVALLLAAFAGGAHAARQVVYIDAADPSWQDTGVSVSAGATVVLHARGRVVHWRSSDGRQFESCGPEGIPGTTHENVYLAPGHAKMGLVGRIGSHVFDVGSSSRLAAPTGGRLYLGINDTNHRGGCADNSGRWTVSIEVQSPVRSAVVQVRAADPSWQDTGLSVPRGARVAFRADGQVVHWRSADGRESQRCGPDGIAGTTHERIYLAPGHAKMGLVGRIGSHVFDVGSSTALTAPTSGRLYLGINDTNHRGGCADNSGQWRVRIELREP